MWSELLKVEYGNQDLLVNSGARANVTAEALQLKPWSAAAEWSPPAATSTLL